LILAHPKTELREAWVDWISEKKWDYFLTVTFRRPRVDTIACSRDVATTLDLTFESRALLMVEPHSSGFPHVHGLVRHDPFMRPTPTPWELWERFYTLYGRSKVEDVKHNYEVSKYLVKYITKDLTDWQIYGTPRAWRI